MSIYIGSAPRLAEDVVRSRRLPSRRAREKNALLGAQPRAAVGRLSFMHCLRDLALTRPEEPAVAAASSGAVYGLGSISPPATNVTFMPSVMVSPVV
jgi:hypothetical protein